MTSTQRSHLERAIERATAHALYIAGKGTRNADGATVYAVSSSSVEGLYHLVAIVGGRLCCSCQAGQRGLICQHRGLIYCHLLTEAEARRGADAMRANARLANAAHGDAWQWWMHGGEW